MSDPKHLEKVAAIKAAADALDAQGIKEAETAYWHCRKTGHGRNRSLRNAVAAYQRYEASRVAGPYGN